MITSLLLWMTIWFCGWAVLYKVQDLFTYHSNIIRTCIYFTLLCSIPIAFFRHLFPSINYSVRPNAVLMILVTGMLLLNVYLLSYLRKGKILNWMQQQTDKFFIRMDARYMVVKIFDLLWQQTMVASLVFIMHSWLQDTLMTVVYVTLIFCAVHLPLVFVQGWYSGMRFTLASSIGGFIFASLILTLESGVLYSFVVHWVFYILLAFYCVWNEYSLFNRNFYYKS